MLGISASSGDEPNVTIWYSFSIDDVGVDIPCTVTSLSLLLLVDKVEIVAKQHGVFLGVSLAKVEEFLRGAGKIWHVMEQRAIILERN